MDLKDALLRGGQSWKLTSGRKMVTAERSAPPHENLSIASIEFKARIPFVNGRFTVNQLVAAIENRKSAKFETAYSRLHPHHQRLSTQPEIRLFFTRKGKRNLYMNIGLFRRLSISVDKHPF